MKVGVLGIDVEFDAVHGHVLCRYPSQSVPPGMIDGGAPYGKRCRRSGKALRCDKDKTISARLHFEEPPHVCEYILPGPTLFDLGDIKLEKIVHPGQKLLPR